MLIGRRTIAKIFSFTIFFVDAMINQDIKDFCDWMRSCLGCLSGRRELSRKRYFIRAIENRGEMVEAFNEFAIELHGGKVVAGLFILSSKNKEPNVRAEIENLASIASSVSDVSVDVLINGGNLNKKFSLTCPVTKQLVIFDDFDAVAFCPQSDNIDDPLYDPLMAAPMPAINFSSDIYALCVFARDLSIQQYGREIADLTTKERDGLFARVLIDWQKIAVKTLQNYIAVTDTSICPTFLTEDRTRWLANHQDPAFAECKKELYSHDMPILYVPKIIDQWNNFFYNGITPTYRQVATPGSFEESDNAS